MPFSLLKIENLIFKNLVESLGEDPNREGLLATPRRVEQSLQDLTRGYEMDLTTLLNGAIFQEEVDEMVLVKDIEFYSLCEHHMLPFFGKVHVAYIPDGKIIGLSKIPRIVEMYARRLQVQERMTTEIAKAIEEALAPRGVAVVTEAAHLCMMMRGVEKQSSSATASCMLGLFREDSRTRSEFLALLAQRRG